MESDEDEDDDNDVRELGRRRQEVSYRLDGKHDWTSSSLGDNCTSTEQEWSFAVYLPPVEERSSSRPTSQTVPVSAVDPSLNPNNPAPVCVPPTQPEPNPAEIFHQAKYQPPVIKPLARKYFGVSRQPPPSPAEKTHNPKLASSRRPEATPRSVLKRTKQTATGKPLRLSQAKPPKLGGLPPLPSRAAPASSGLAKSTSLLSERASAAHLSEVDSNSGQPSNSKLVASRLQPLPPLPRYNPVQPPSALPHRGPSVDHQLQLENLLKQRAKPMSAPTMKLPPLPVGPTGNKKKVSAEAKSTPAPSSARKKTKPGHPAKLPPRFTVSNNDWVLPLQLSMMNGKPPIWAQ